MRLMQVAQFSTKAGRFSHSFVSKTKMKTIRFSLHLAVCPQHMCELSKMTCYEVKRLYYDALWLCIEAVRYKTYLDRSELQQTQLHKMSIGSRRQCCCTLNSFRGSRPRIRQYLKSTMHYTHMNGPFDKYDVVYNVFL